MKITFIRYWLIFLFIIFIFSGCETLRERMEEFSTAKIAYTDCTEYKKKLEEINVRSMVTFWDWIENKNDYISNDSGTWLYEDHRNDKNNDIRHELYRLRLDRMFSFSVINVTGFLYKIYNNGEISYKVSLGYETPGYFNWFENGTMNVYIDLPNKIMVINDYEGEGGFYLFGYLEEGFLLDKDA
ncbi:MAG: hypothetical protein JW969_13355 [Spirochaetales bacterium]|nr:hypothetical protein [Spirochaetales bacterium]